MRSGGKNMKTEFDKIAGYKEEKKELLDTCFLIKKSKELEEAGGKLPRGMCLIGPNGVGKTVLAKAFIAEANCKVVQVDCNDICDDSDFVEYIKAKFAEAASCSPCILFVDELDKLIGNNRDFFMPTNFDRSRVLLNEINRYSSVNGLFLLFVVNNERYLDYSIIRSGRIDKTISINLQNEKERIEIIKHYCRGKKIDDSIDFKELSKECASFSGADIESLLNNAVIKAFTDSRQCVSNKDIMDAYYDKVFNCKEKESLLNQKDLTVVAYHEAGHAAMTLLTNPLSLSYATILPRNNVRGFVKQKQDEGRIETFDAKKEQIKIALSGMAAEELFTGKRTLGSSYDISVARRIIMNLVRKQGMCGFDKTEIPCSFESEAFPIEDSHSDERIKRIEDQEDKILEDLYESTKNTLFENKDLVEAIVEKLLVKKILNKEDIENIYSNFNKKGA